MKVGPEYNESMKAQGWAPTSTSYATECNDKRAARMEVDLEYKETMKAMFAA